VETITKTDVDAAWDTIEDHWRAVHRLKTARRLYVDAAAESVARRAEFDDASDGLEESRKAHDIAISVLLDAGVEMARGRS
jgi:hypothetical protein